jgi:D-alanyl-D-alanine dipeptidase
MRIIVLLIGVFLMAENLSAKCPITLLIHPKVLMIPIKETYEPMIDLKQQNALLFGPSPEIPNNHNYTKIRKTVYEKLLIAQRELPLPLKFCLYECYRSLSLQEKLFQERYHKLKKLHSGWSHPALFRETAKLISPVINLDGSRNIPPHSTGGAIDIYLVDEKGDPVEMGILAKDWMQDTDGSLSQTDALKISQAAKSYRKIMSDALSSVGFVNYPAEYWHWSYGDRYWAYHSHHPFALYDEVKEQ